MNKVIFIVLLSFSTCFSLPSEPEAAKPNSPPNLGDNKTAPKPGSESVKNATAPIIVTTPHAEPAHEQEVKTNATTPADPKDAKTQSSDSKATPTITATNTTVPEQKTNSTAKTDTENKDKKSEDPKKTDDKKEQKGVPSSTSVEPTLKPDQKNGTASEQITPKPTATPKPEDKQDAAKLQARGFDGASFVGGMILTLGLLAVGFIGFRYYRAQNAERNYHTL